MCPAHLMLDAAGVEVEVVWDLVHEPDEAPEGVDLVLHHEQDRRQEVGHALKKSSEPL